MARRTDWEILPEPEGDVEVTHGGRTRRHFGTEVQALAWAFSQRGETERVFVVEPDGYRMNVTRRGTRTRPR